MSRGTQGAEEARTSSQGAVASLGKGKKSKVECRHEEGTLPTCEGEQGRKFNPGWTELASSRKVTNQS